MKKSSSSNTLDSTNTDDSDSSPKDSSIQSAASGIPPMPIRKMKDLTEGSNIAADETKFQKNAEGGKEANPNAQLVGYKSTGEKPEGLEPVLTKEELKNRELEKVKQKYALQQKEETETDNHGGGAFGDSDSGSLSSGSSTKKSGEEKKTQNIPGLQSLTEELKAVEDDVKPNQVSLKFCFINVNISSCFNGYYVH